MVVTCGDASLCSVGIITVAVDSGSAGLGK